MRRSLARRAALLAALLAVAACTASTTPPAPATALDWPLYRGDVARDGHPSSATLTADQAARLAVSWTALLDGAVDGTPVVAAGRVVAMSDRGEIAAFDLRSGARLWARQGLGSFTGSAAVEGGTVFAGSLTGHVYALDLASGRTSWDWIAPGTKPAVWSSPAVSGGLVLVGIGSQAGDQPLESGGVFGLDAASGRERWRLCVEAGCAPGGGVSSSVALDGAGHGFVGTGNPDDGVLAFDVATGNRLWATSLHEDRGLDLDVVATPIVAEVGGRSIVAVGSDGGLFDVLDASTGAVVWSRFLVAGSAVHGLIASPAFDGEAFYVPSASPPTGLFALDPMTGHIQWEQLTDLAVYSAPAAGRHVLIFGTGDYFGDAGRGRMFALSTTDGAVVWSYDLKHSTFSAPAIIGTTVLAGDTGGELLAFRPS